ncbi:MAG: hypothetical protein AMXMBFR64_53820 [Myxococcales bacterium]
MCDGAAAHAEYVRVVEQLLVLVRRRGLMLSAADWRMAQQWAEAGIPLTVVCRAVLRAVEGFRAEHGPARPLPGSLAYFAPAVRDEAALDAAKALSVGDGGDAVGAAERRAVQRLLVDVEDVGRSEKDDGVRAAYRELWRDLKAVLMRIEAGRPGSLVSELIGAQERLVSRVWSGLDSEARAGIDAEVERALTGVNLGPEGLSERRAALRERATMERFGLLRVWDP